MKVFRASQTWRVEVDGHEYRVTRDSWHSGGSWTVCSPNSNRICDPDKPTHKRVVAAVTAMITERGGQGAFSALTADPPPPPKFDIYADHKRRVDAERARVMAKRAEAERTGRTRPVYVDSRYFD